MEERMEVGGCACVCVCEEEEEEDDAGEESR